MQILPGYGKVAFALVGGRHDDREPLDQRKDTIMRNSNSTKTTENKVIRIDEAKIRNHLCEMVRSTVLARQGARRSARKSVN